MELTELKRGIHASIDEVEDENILLEIMELLKTTKETDTEDLSYESSPEFIAQINEAIRQVENGEVYSHEEAMNYLKNRAWRTK